jgi:hypothetical protein
MSEFYNLILGKKVNLKNKTSKNKRKNKNDLSNKI